MKLMESNEEEFLLAIKTVAFSLMKTIQSQNLIIPGVDTAIQFLIAKNKNHEYNKTTNNSFE